LRTDPRDVIEYFPQRYRQLHAHRVDSFRGQIAMPADAIANLREWQLLRSKRSKPASLLPAQMRPFGPSFDIRTDGGQNDRSSLFGANISQLVA